MKLRFKIDGAEVDHPLEAAKLELVIRYDPELRGLLFEYPSSLTFTGDGYTTLRTGWDMSGPCGASDLLVEILPVPSGSWETVFNGLILYKDIEFRISDCLAECAIVDDSWSGRISRNRSIKFNIRSDITKNEVKLGATGLSEQIDFFDTSGSYTVSNRPGYSAYTCLQRLIECMSDDECEFDSLLFGPGGEGEYIYFLTGHMLRDAAVDDLYISFDDAYNDLRNLFNLGFYVDLSGLKPKIWIEKLSDIPLSATSLTVTNVRGLIEATDRNAYYSKVEIGSGEELESEGGTYTWPDIVGLSHKREEFHVQSVCNEEAGLDLSLVYCIDSNVFEKIVTVNIAANDDEYDDVVLIVECEQPSGGGLRAIAYDIFSPGGDPYSYNYLLSNVQVLNRYENYMPGPLAQSLSDSDDTFSAYSAVGYTSTSAAGSAVYPYDTETSDPGSNYSTVTYRYTAAADGLFVFDAKVFCSAFSSSSGNERLELTLSIVHYDSGVSTEKSRVSTTINLNTGEAGLCTVKNAQIYMNTSDVVRVEIDWAITFGSGVYSLTLDAGTGYTFRCTADYDGGGVFADFDPQDYRAILYRFERGMGWNDWQAVAGAIREQVEFGTTATASGAGWPREIRYPLNGGQTSFILYKSQNDA